MLTFNMSPYTTFYSVSTKDHQTATKSPNFWNTNVRDNCDSAYH